MTSNMARIAAASLATAVLLALLDHHPHRHHPNSPVVTPRATAVPGAEAVVRAFVVALTHLDVTHPRGDLPAMRALCDPPLLQQLLLTTPTTPGLLPRGAVQRGVITAVAIRPVDAGAVAFVTVELTDTTPSTPPLRTAATVTVSLHQRNLRWVVTGVTT